MSATARDATGRQAWVTGTREPKLFEIAYTLGASGDPAAGTLLKRSDTGILLVRTGVGLFTLTVPAFPPLCQVRLGFSSIQAVPTVADMVCLTQVNSTGVLTLRFFANAIATPVEFTSGDQLTVWAWVDTKTDT